MLKVNNDLFNTSKLLKHFLMVSMALDWGPCFNSIAHNFIYLYLLLFLVWQAENVAFFDEEPHISPILGFCPVIFLFEFLFFFGGLLSNHFINYFYFFWKKSWNSFCFYILVDVLDDLFLKLMVIVNLV